MRKLEIICAWDKRKKCDSLYAECNRKLVKKIKKVLDVVERCTDEKVKAEIKKILEKTI